MPAQPRSDSTRDPFRDSDRPTPTSGVYELPTESRDLTLVTERREMARKLAIVAAMRIGLVTMALGVSLAFVRLDTLNTDEVSTWQYTLIGVAYVVSLLYVLALRTSQRLDVLAYVQVVVDSALVTGLVLMTGGSESIFSFAYVFVVLGSAMILYRRGAALGTLVCLLLFGTLVSVQAENILSFLPRLKASTAVLSFFIYAIGLVLVGWLASTLAETARARARALAAKESEFEQLEELHAAILRSLPAGLMTLDGEGLVRYVNDSALAILRYRYRDVIGQTVRAISPSIAEPWALILRQGRIPNPRDRFEGNFTRLDGSTIRLGFSFAPLSPRPNEFGLIVVFQDVTDIVRLKEAVERSERLASIGKLAAGLAHEVRNPLASMCASIDVLKGALNPPDAMKRLMENVVIESDRLNVLITDFLDFARPHKLDLANTDLSLLVSGVIEVFKNDVAFKDCELSVSVESGLLAHVDADSVRQVIWNLARNAIQAMAERSHSQLTIITRSSENLAEIVVRDKGTGIPEDALNRVFDPFYTTKDEGTGLGLAIAHSIVQAHGGSIFVSSSPGEGTEFVIGFPRIDALVYERFPDETDPALDVTPSNFEILGGPI